MLPPTDKLTTSIKDNKEKEKSTFSAITDRKHERLQSEKEVGPVQKKKKTTEDIVKVKQEEDKNKLYCICRTPYDDSKYVVNIRN